VLQLMELTLDEYLATGEPPAPGGALLTGGYACYDVYEAADGQWLAVAALEPRFFANLCEALGRPELAARQLDPAAQPQLRRALASAFRTRPREEWVARLAPLDTCVSPVLTVEEVVAADHWTERGAFCDFDHPDRGRVRQLGPFGDEPCTARGDPPAADGTQSEEVLAGAGFTAAEIAALKADGVVR
jgi:crotonobetainyl-CoA:carnitine CoA-transferase CaiB-like acyl-CoA transferase